MANMKRLSSLQDFLSQFTAGDVYESNAVRVQENDGWLRIVWEGHGPDDVDCGVAVFSPHGSMTKMGAAHLWGDLAPSAVRFDKPGRDGVMEENPLNFNEFHAETIREWLGCF